MIVLTMFVVAFLAFMAGYEAGWYVARDPEGGSMSDEVKSMTAIRNGVDEWHHCASCDGHACEEEAIK